MKLSPFGCLHIWQRDKLKDSPYKKFAAFNGTDQQYRDVMENWYQEMQDSIWPLYDKNGHWQGKAKKLATTATRLEIEIQLKHLQNKNILDAMPNSIEGSVKTEYRRDHRWHYRVEDAKHYEKEYKYLPEADHTFEYRASAQPPAANFNCYCNGVDINEFKTWFWKDAGKRMPAFFSIKNDFQRPRPWTTAMSFRLDDFVWDKAESWLHTGIHPAFPSGHCFQGILHGVNALNEWNLAAKSGEKDDTEASNSISPPSPDALNALQQYSVDWGDRRVFAGVHYLTDNIASWVLAVQLIPMMYDKDPTLVDFAKSAIKSKSLVYKIIQKEFKKYSSLKPALDLLNKYIT